MAGNDQFVRMAVTVCSMVRTNKRTNVWSGYDCFRPFARMNARKGIRMGRENYMYVIYIPMGTSTGAGKTVYLVMLTAPEFWFVAGYEYGTLLFT